MEIRFLKTTATLVICFLVLAEVSDASMGRKLLKWLIKKRRDILFLPIPIPIWSQKGHFGPSVEQASFAWQRRDPVPWSPPDYYPQVPPPYPEDYLYPYP